MAQNLKPFRCLSRWVCDSLVDKVAMEQVKTLECTNWLVVTNANHTELNIMKSMIHNILQHVKQNVSNGCGFQSICCMSTWLRLWQLLFDQFLEQKGCSIAVWRFWLRSGTMQVSEYWSVSLDVFTIFSWVIWNRMSSTPLVCACTMPFGPKIDLKSLPHLTWDSCCVLQIIGHVCPQMPGAVYSVTLRKCLGAGIH